MSENSYRVILGISLLLGLYFELYYFIYGISVVLLLEALTNYTLPKLYCSLANSLHPEGKEYIYVRDSFKHRHKINIESERVWRFMVGLIVAVSFYFYQQLWFVPWFMGFTIFAAGISGICPMFLMLRLIGFK